MDDDASDPLAAYRQLAGHLSLDDQVELLRQLAMFLEYTRFLATALKYGMQETDLPPDKLATIATNLDTSEAWWSKLSESVLGKPPSDSVM